MFAGLRLALRDLGHLAPAVGAAAALLGAGQHLLVAVRHLLALRRAALAINREGSFAVVGYDALISLIDLREERVVQNVDVPVLVADVALRDASWIYAGSEILPDGVG